MSSLWTILGGALIGAGGNYLGSSMSASASRSAANDSWRRTLNAQPDRFNSGFEALLGQASVGLGVDADTLELDLISRELDRNAKIPQLARDFRSGIDTIQNMLNRGETSGKGFNRAYFSLLGLVNTYTNADLVIEDGKVKVRSRDPGIRSMVDYARENSEQIRLDRLTAEQNLARLAADYPTATGEEIDALTSRVREQQEREINERAGESTDRILQQANARGYNPAGILSDLERERTQALYDTQFSAADRALQILTGRQAGADRSISGINSAISPARFLALLAGDPGAAAQSQAAATIGQLAAAQTQAASANSGSGVAAASQGLGDALTLYGLLSRSPNETNRSLRGPATGTADRITSGGIDLTDIFLKQ